MFEYCLISTINQTGRGCCQLYWSPLVVIAKISAADFQQLLWIVAYVDCALKPIYRYKCHIYLTLSVLQHSPSIFAIDGCLPPEV